MFENSTGIKLMGHVEQINKPETLICHKFVLMNKVHIPKY